MTLPDERAANLLRLAEKVDSLSGPCRDTDGKIMKAVCPRLIDLWPYWSDTERELIVPRYTGSLEAAMTLVPDEYNASVEWNGMGGYAWLYPPDNTNDISYEGGADTPALALATACLRAHAAIAKEQS